MKLRLRSLESKETHKIEIPNSYNLQQLKEVIILQLFPSSSSSTSESLPHTLLLSLNRKEELCGSSPEESLQSLGVTSGDLIYYTRNPYAFSSENPNLSHVQLGNFGGISTSNDKIVDLMNAQKSESGELNVSSAGIRNLMNTQMEGSSKLGNPSDDTSNLGNTQMLESKKVDEFIGSRAGIRELMDTQVEGSSKLSDLNEGKSVDEMEVDDEFEAKNYFKFSVPSFLKKVYVKEVGDAAANGGDHRLLVIAVHAVLLESGFVGYDPVSGMKVDGFHLAEEWPSLAFGMTLYYTLPEVSTSEVVETVVLKFQTLGKFVNIYGSLTTKGFGVHRVSLDEPRFLPALSFVWKRSYQNDFQNEIDGSGKLYPNQEIFKFWKIVKDGLSYPLLIDLCEQVGLVSPPCFMRLPTELKLKILESLPAIDVARVECVSSELRFVASNNDLWKLKYEEFGNAAASQRECQWKAKYCSVLEFRKKSKPFQRRDTPHFRPLILAGRRNPSPFGSRFIVGGDYDRLPTFGVPQHPGRRIFRTNCDSGFGL